MSVTKTMYVKENSFRKLDDPFNSLAKKYVFYVKICDVPGGIPMATNPRDQRLTSGVAQAIQESLESNDGYFHLKNRGIVLSAKSCTYNNQTKEVKLQQKFDPIKEGLEGMPFFSRIAFKQNQQAFDEENNKRLKMIDAREIVSIINMFNIDKFNSMTHPIRAYSSKAKMLELYLEDPESYRRYVNIMPDIFDLYDAIEMEFATAFNETGGRYGRKKYSGYKDGKVIGSSKFGLHEIYYKIPDGLIYPTVAAFRSLVILNEQTGKYEWKNGVNPITVWDKCKKNLTNQIMNFASAIGDNPNAVGKDSNIWNLAYMTVLLQQEMN